MPSTSTQPPPCDVPTASATCTTLPQAAVMALWRGQIGEALTLVCIEQNIGEEEANEQVEAYMHTHPALKAHIVQVHADAREGLLRWVIFFLVGGTGLFFVLT